MEATPPTSPGRFLTARWEHLVLVTWAVPPELIAPLLPRGVQPDIQEGQAFVSLVAFEFNNTRIKGIPVPFHINFPEVNLRYYARRGEEVGVGFVREIVNRPAITAVANGLYNEHYRTMPLKLQVTRRPKGKHFRYTLGKNGRLGHIDAELTGKAWLPEDEDSVEDYFKERPWGYGKRKNGDGLRYRVWHPRWEVMEYSKLTYYLNYGALFGKEWAFLKDQQPYHEMVARGSEIIVYNAQEVPARRSGAEPGNSAAAPEKAAISTGTNA